MIPALSYSDIFPDPIIDLIDSIEYSFALVHYINHEEDLNHAHNTEPLQSGTIKDVASQILYVYREHLSNVLSAQGVHLANPFLDPLKPLTDILAAVCQLGTSDPKELYATGVYPDDQEDATVFVLSIVSQLTHYAVETLLGMVASVNEDILIHLHPGESGLDLITGIAQRSRERFLAVVNTDHGIVVDLIRNNNYFGYDLDVWVMQHVDELSKIADESNPAEEIIALVMGSSTDQAHLPTAMYALSEHYIDDPTRCLKVNAEISKWLTKHNG